MKIVLDLPDWVEGKALRIFAGIEEVARRRNDQDFWMVKGDRCSQCGYCCTKVNHDHFMGVNPHTGHCRYLNNVGEQFHCIWGRYRPFACSAGDNADGKKCSVTWKRADGGK